MSKQIEERVAHLEAEVAILKSKVKNDLPPEPWWEKISGTFSDNSAYDEAMELGREYRDSLRPIDAESSDD